MPRLTRRAFAAAIMTIATFGPISAAALADDWPSKPVTIIVSYAPGGSTDILARKIADELGKLTDQSIIVQNFAGAGGTLGTTTAAQAEPDGYTLFLGQISSHGIAPAIYAKLSYDPVADFTPIARVYSIPNVLVVPHEFPANSYEQFLKVAKEKTLRFASSGVGSSIHLSGELFKLATGLEMVHVPFRGSGEAKPALVGGFVDLMFDNAPSAIPLVKAGSLKALAVTTAERSAELPSVPTLREVGGEALGDFSVQAWFGVFAPAGLDPALVDRINANLNEVFESPAFREFAKSQAAIVNGGSPEDLAQHVESELATWAKVIETAGIEKK